MGNISEHATLGAKVPTSPSHGSLALYSTFSTPRQQGAHNQHGPEVTSPVSPLDLTLERRQKAALVKVEATHSCCSTDWWSDWMLS